MNSARKALHIGAGKIGRGFIGERLAESGYTLTFADVNNTLVEAVNHRQGYTVHIMECDGGQVSVEGIVAVNIRSNDFIEAFAEADIVTTAVSMGVLPQISAIMAEALAERCRRGICTPLNIVCCENGVRATSQLQQLVLQHLDPAVAEWCRGKVGFADCSVDRIVPVATFDEPLDVGVERYCEWNIDRRQIVGALPDIVGVKFTDNLEASIERKLFTLNTAHCATAYLGALKGYKYIHEAIIDSNIRTTVERIAEQSSAALVAKFSLDPAEQMHYAKGALRRFENPFLRDTVARVARDPMRKLSPQLYFAYPAAMSLQYNLPIDALAVAVAAALHYRSADDGQSMQIAELIAQNGTAACAQELTGIADSDFLHNIESTYHSFL